MEPPVFSEKSPDVRRAPGSLCRALLGSVAGLALTGGMSSAQAQYATGGAATSPPGERRRSLPTLSVQGSTATSGGDYKADQPSLPKLTEPLLDTPQSIDVVTRQVMDDQGVTTLRDALRNVPGISLAAGENSSQGDNLTIRGFTARNDIYLDGLRDRPSLRVATAPLRSSTFFIEFSTPTTAPETPQHDPGVLAPLLHVRHFSIRGAHVHHLCNGPTDRQVRTHCDYGGSVAKSSGWADLVSLSENEARPPT